MYLKPLLVLLCAFACHILPAQITVLGKFSIGDKSNLQILKTHRGDQFYGWVSSWTADTIVFSSQNNITIAFPVSDVNSIEVGNENQVGGLATEVFKLQTKSGLVYYGYPTKINRKLIGFEASQMGFLRVRPQDVESIEPIIVTLVSREPYVNEYAVYPRKGKIPDGRFLGFGDGIIEHIDATGHLHEASVESLNTYKLAGQPLPYQGQGRSLMFAQTGFGMKPKEKEYRNIMLAINILSFGINEHISVATGLIYFLPYADIKVSQSFGKYVHMSAGAYGLLPFSVGLHGTLSLGTPNYFLNIGVNKNYENRALYADFSFENFNVGASIRSGRRSRVFAEYHIMTSEFNRDFFGSSTFYRTGFASSFSWGYGWYNKRFRFETGVMETGPYQAWTCSGPSCNDYYHVPVPFFSMAIKFRR